MRRGERQIGRTLSRNQPDHIERYYFAASKLRPGSRVLDCACGVGYGSTILANAGMSVVGVDVDCDAADFAALVWAHPAVTYIAADAQALPQHLGSFDAVVSFETLEHLDDPRLFLSSVDAALLIGSVPNQDRIPFDPEVHIFHKAHYRASEIADLVKPFRLTGLFGQHSKTAPVSGTVAEARTIVFTAARQDA